MEPIYRLDERIDRLYFTGVGPDTPFGIIEIGRTSGRVLRGWIRYDADSPRRRYGSATAVRDAVRTLRAVHVPAGR